MRIKNYRKFKETTIAEKVRKLRLNREPGYLYFIDKQGDISRTLMARGAKKSTSKASKKKVEKKGKKTTVKRITR
jgi:putative component of toxin-antitoxin plasmid stabilization module